MSKLYFKMTQIINITNTFESYQQLIDFYLAHKEKEFDTIHVELHKWFWSQYVGSIGSYFRCFLL